MASPGGSAPEPRIAVVTGAARGIGAATVRTLVARGWSVVAVDCDDVPAAERVVPCVADVTDLDALGGAVALAEERFGGLDAMIAVAGVIAGGGAPWGVAGGHEGGGARGG